MSTVPNPNISEQFLCCYVNNTSSIQIGKINPASGLNAERVIFPGDRFLFEASTSAKLKLYVEIAGEMALFSSIPCSQLTVQTISPK